VESSKGSRVLSQDIAIVLIEEARRPPAERLGAVPRALDRTAASNSKDSSGSKSATQGGIGDGAAGCR
jgi:hypothetical protein